MSSILALIDCNNFFVSCERVFNPKLEKKAVVVLSSNDGCVVSRSPEAKAIGIKMGARLFEYRDLFRKKGVVTLSSNFSLYGDMSNRVMESLQSFGFPIDIYSIDEAFIELPELSSLELTRLGQEIRNKIKSWTGIPTAIGIGKTKTLAKAANECAKKQTGVALAVNNADRETILSQLPVEDIWGIGRSSASFLREYGITNALQLQASPDDWIRKHLTVGGLRTVLELRGISCLESSISEKIAQSLVCSRSFGRTVIKLEELEEAVSHHASRVAEKLRAGGLCATIFGVFVGSGYLKSESASSLLHFPSAETSILIAKARQLVTALYRKGLL